MKTLSEHILDIVQNSVRAKATLIEIIVEESKKNNLCVLTIKDNGCGMGAEMLGTGIQSVLYFQNHPKSGFRYSPVKA